MDRIEKLRPLATRNGGIIDNQTAGACGVSRQVLAKLCVAGVIQRIARGQYILADNMQDDLLSIGKRSTNLIFFMRQLFFFMGSPTGCPLSTR